MAKRKWLFDSQVQGSNWLQESPSLAHSGKGALSALAALIRRRGGQENVELANSMLSPLPPDSVMLNPEAPDSMILSPAPLDEHVTVQPKPQE
jgi:hypothetical protein